MDENNEKRQGKTGVWTFLLKTPEDRIIATSEWGTNYEFHEQQWLEIPIINDNLCPPHSSTIPPCPIPV